MTRGRGTNRFRNHNEENSLPRLAPTYVNVKQYSKTRVRLILNVDSSNSTSEEVAQAILTSLILAHLSLNKG